MGTTKKTFLITLALALLAVLTSINPFRIENGELILATPITEAAPLGTKIIASDDVGNDNFGRATAIDGDFAIVGAPFKHNPSDDEGAAYIYERSGSAWNQVAKLSAGDRTNDDQFGYSVDISGDTAVVGARYDDDAGASSGSAYIFVKPGANWSNMTNHTAKLTASDATGGDQFGYSVGISGDVAIVGSPYDDDAGSSSGSAYIFVKSGSWTTTTQNAKLTANDSTGDDQFGYAVDIDGDDAIVGAPKHNHTGTCTRCGVIYVFTKPGGGWSGNLNQTAELDPWTGGLAEFAITVAISGDYIIGGGSRKYSGKGSIWIFTKPAVGGWVDVWDHPYEKAAFDGISDDYFGHTVGISNDYAIVGAYGNDDDGSMSGSAYIFKRTGASTWDGGTKITATDGAANDYYGWSVGMAGDYAIVGAYRNDDGGSSSGSAYVYETSTIPVAPDAPTSLTIGTLTGSTIDISWTDNSDNETGFYIYSNTTNSKPGSYTLSVGTNVESTQLSSLDPYTQYYIWVETYNAHGTSSDITNNTTTTGPTPSVTCGFDQVTIDQHSHALRYDKRIFSWGNNYGGARGGGSQTTPIANLENVVEVSAGRNQSIALLEDGTVWAWGWNAAGQVGDGTNTDRSTPVQVLANPSAVAGVGPYIDDAIDVDAGNDGSIVVKSDGTVWTFGSGQWGRLGLGVPLVIISLRKFPFQM